jgi:hypothetical protein
MSSYQEFDKLTDELDAAIFSGDALCLSKCRRLLRDMLPRWQRELDSITLHRWEAGDPTNYYYGEGCIYKQAIDPNDHSSSVKKYYIT